MILLLSLVISLFIAVAAALFIKLLKSFYIRNLVLRLDPLEERKLSCLDHSNEKQLWFIGDSRAAHWNTGFLGTLNLKIVNRALDGQTSMQVYERFRKDVKIMSPEWIIVQVGINDLKTIGLVKGGKKQIIENCFGNITGILEIAKANNVKMIFTPILATGKIEHLRRFIWSKDMDAIIKGLNIQLENYCALNNIIFYNINDILCDNHFEIRDEFQNGFLHLNDEAYTVVSNGLINNYGGEINITNS